MTQYISKTALVAEINRLQEATMDKNQNFLSSYHEGIFDGLSMLENFLDTLEVKEIGFDIGSPEGDKSAVKEVDLEEAAVEIARGEMIEKACSWLRDYQEYPAHDIDTDKLIKAFKEYVGS